jgi:hypothetical protein
LERIPNFDGLSVDECKRVMSIGERVRVPEIPQEEQPEEPGEDSDTDSKNPS